jgi:hypothetical protein
MSQKIRKNSHQRVLLSREIEELATRVSGKILQIASQPQQ